MCATYYARTSDHGYETCAEHLAMAGCLAGGFAKGFGYLDDGLLAGLVHDLGKYFQSTLPKGERPYASTNTRCLSSTACGTPSP